MSKDIIIIIGFIITIIILCKLWNYFMMKQYEKSKMSKKNKKKIECQQPTDSSGGL